MHVDQLFLNLKHSTVNHCLWFNWYPAWEVLYLEIVDEPTVFKH